MSKYINNIGNEDQTLSKGGFGGGEEEDEPTPIIPKPDTGGGSTTSIPIHQQSPDIYIQAAGSTGADGSAKGIHLRWAFKNDLGDKHLPKGHYSSNTHHYNKPNDFVKVYRAPYPNAKLNLELYHVPTRIDDAQASFHYTVAQTTFTVKFLNASRYAYARGSMEPNNFSSFYQYYGSYTIEIENPQELFFDVRWDVEPTHSTATLEVEGLTEENLEYGTPKRIACRKTFASNELIHASLEAENLRSIRFRPVNCEVGTIAFTLYSNVMAAIEAENAWTLLGEFALSTDTTSSGIDNVFKRFEPSTNLVHQKWPRYDSQTKVNRNHYVDRWNGTPATPDDRNLSTIVSNYLSLSNAADNPKGIEILNFNVSDGQTESIDISTLDFLQIAAMDYHIARMLGLGHLDVDSTVWSGQYIYLMEYPAEASDAASPPDPEQRTTSTSSEQTKTHQYLSLPTALQDERLPLTLELKNPVLGIRTHEQIAPENTALDAEGYTPDGKSQYMTLFIEELPEYTETLFYESNQEYNISQETFPVHAGLKYKKAPTTTWLSPDLSHTQEYITKLAGGTVETIPLTIPELFEPLYIHRERNTGISSFAAYGINWFSRASAVGSTKTVNSSFKPKSLLAPHSVMPLLIPEESPRILTSSQEQTIRSAIQGQDKTMLRVALQFDAIQDLMSYPLTDKDRLSNFPNDALSSSFLPDDPNDFAEEIEVFFRPKTPINVRGQVKSITDDVNPVLSIIRTQSYHLLSQGTDIIPELDSSDMANFQGSIFLLEEEEYIVHSVVASTVTNEGPIFTVYKKVVSDALRQGLPSLGDDLESPKVKGDGLFMAIENMQNIDAWSGSQASANRITIGANWPIHREIIEKTNGDGQVEYVLEKSRGFWENATIQPMTPSATHPNFSTDGLYQISFDHFTLAHHHPAYESSSQHWSEWKGGTVRIHTSANPNGPRKTLQVERIDNIGTSNTIVLCVRDQQPDEYASILTGTQVSVQFYPGYVAYFFQEFGIELDETSVLPSTGEGVQYSIVGTRSRKQSQYSPISTPKVVFAQELVQAEQPQLPVGTAYATRPDSFGKATYSFTTAFTHTPYAALFSRADDLSILNILYDPALAKSVKEVLSDMNPSELTRLWEYFLGFDYPDGFEEFDGYELPFPNNPEHFTGTPHPVTVQEEIKALVEALFVPLTELPIIYKHIKDNTPAPRKQVIKDKNGYLLNPDDPNSGYDIAPMAQKLPDGTVLFTDFNLPGGADRLYFYATREMGNTMQLGEWSPILGPVKLVNTTSPKAPEVRRVMPVLENEVLGVSPSIYFELNHYPQNQHIKQISLYRTTNPAEALSVRSMERVMQFELDSAMKAESVWGFKDEFTDLNKIPYGKPLFYRIVVSKEVEYADKNGIIKTMLVASEASKLLVSTIVEVTAPISPTLNFDSQMVTGGGVIEEFTDVVFQWESTMDNGRYHLYKMNNQGTWQKIHSTAFITDDTVNIPLASTTIDSDQLTTFINNQLVYHHFKAISENSAGLFSNEELILTLPN